MTHDKRVFGVKNTGHWLFFVGDCTGLSKFLRKKSVKSPWIIIKILDAFFRGYGQIVFCNNPFSGILILVSLAVVNPLSSLLGFFGALTGLFMSLAVRQPYETIFSGRTVLNPLLMGFACGLLPELSELYYSPLLMLYLLIFWIFCVYISSAFESLLKAISLYPLPALTLSFNIVQLLLMVTLTRIDLLASENALNMSMPIDQNETFIDEFQENSNETSLAETTHDLDWGLFFQGVLTSMSQIFFTENVPASLIIYLAMLIYSPIMASFAFLGAFLASLTGGFIFGPNLHKEIYSGLWGFNGILCAAALGGLYFVVTLQSSIVVIVAVIFNVVLQNTLTLLFEQANLPALLLPSNLTTLLFLCATSGSKHGLVRPANITFPERHRFEYRMSLKSNKNESVTYVSEEAFTPTTTQQ